MTPALPQAPGPGGPLRIGSLCTGYGGLELAVTAVLDAEVAWYAEHDPHAAAVLAAQWPDLRNLGDITALDWADVPPVDLMTAGWPCQDISYAGTGSGIMKGTRSGLWHCIAVGLRQLRPEYVFVENVAALRTRGLAEVLGDLAALGYDTQWTGLRACDAGSCHRRDRLFILAHQPAAGPGRRCLERRGTSGAPVGPPGPAGKARTLRRRDGHPVGYRDPAAAHPDGQRQCPRAEPAPGR